MSKINKFIVIVVCQALVFYLFPLVLKPFGAIGMVFIILLATFVLSSVLGAFSYGFYKWLYPILVAVLFVPSVFVYYNNSALIQAVWYLVVSFVGVTVGALIGMLSKK